MWLKTTSFWLCSLCAWDLYHILVSYVLSKGSAFFLTSSVQRISALGGFSLVCLSIEHVKKCNNIKHTVIQTKPFLDCVDRCVILYLKTSLFKLVFKNCFSGVLGKACRRCWHHVTSAQYSECPNKSAFFWCTFFVLTECCRKGGAG